MQFPEYTSLTLEEKQKRIADLRILYKNAKTETDRKIITVRANMLKRTIKEIV